MPPVRQRPRPYARRRPVSVWNPDLMLWSSVGVLAALLLATLSVWAEARGIGAPPGTAASVLVAFVLAAALGAFMAWREARS